MKKTFLIAGALGAIIATNGYAVSSQEVVVNYSCPAGCVLKDIIEENGYTRAWCYCDEGIVDPTITISQLTPSPATIQEVMSSSPLNQAAIKNAKKMKTTSARAATVSPKVVKKVVYEEIISDDAE